MKLDWDAGHGPVTGPINAGMATLAAGWAGNATHLTPGWAAAAASAGMLGTHLAGRRHAPGYTLTMRAAGWLGAGTWCSLALANGPWTTWSLGSLVVGTIALGTAMTGTRHADARADKHAEKTAQADTATLLSGRRAALAQEWNARLAGVCTGLLVQIAGIEDWDSGTGYTLDGECSGGTKWRDFLPYQDSLAANAKLPEGCGVTVKPGAHRGAVLFDVSTSNALIADAPYPDDYSPISLNDPSPHGIYRDGSAAAPVMRQRSSLTSGRRGSGKTNLMNVKIANQSRMTDNLTWVIDLNGGGLALAWLHKWREAGRPGRPPIDWVADTPEKALAMVEALLRIAKARKPGYKHLEIAADDDKLPVTPAVPGITLTNDEIAELFSPRARRDPLLRDIGDIIVQIQEIGRAAACNVDQASLRVTQDVVSEPQVVKQSALKIALKADETELAYMLGWNEKLSTDDAPYPGCGFIKIDDEPANPFKVYRITPGHIGDIVTATASLHPELDDLSRRAAGEAYEHRWDGTDHLFGTAAAPAAAGTTPPPAPAAPPETSGVTAGWDTPTPGTSDASVQEALDAADAARKRLHDAMSDATIRDPDLDQQFQDIITGGGAVWQPPADPTIDTPKGDPRRDIVLDIVAKSGPGGIGPAAILDAVRQLHPDLDPPHPDVVARWLAADPRIHKPRHGRYAFRPGQDTR